MSLQQRTLLCHYRYDPFDRLINQTQPDTPAHQRFYCKSRLVTEMQGAMQYSIIQHGDQLLASAHSVGLSRIWRKSRSCEIHPWHHPDR